jgi:hypothetical protein
LCVVICGFLSDCIIVRAWFVAVSGGVFLLFCGVVGQAGGQIEIPLHCFYIASHLQWRAEWWLCIVIFILLLVQ